MVLVSNFQSLGLSWWTLPHFSKCFNNKQNSCRPLTVSLQIEKSTDFCRRKTGKKFKCNKHFSAIFKVATGAVD